MDIGPHTLINHLCVACLSLDRKLHSCDEECKIQFVQFLGLSVDFIHQPLQLCWECRASVKNVFKFKRKVLQARQFLNRHLLDKLPTTISLSNLQISKTHITFLPPLEIEQDQTDEQNNIYYFMYDDDKFCNEKVETITSKDYQETGINLSKPLTFIKVEDQDGDYFETLEGHYADVNLDNECLDDLKVAEICQTAKNLSPKQNYSNCHSLEFNESDDEPLVLKKNDKPKECRRSGRRKKEKSDNMANYNRQINPSIKSNNLSNTYDQQHPEKNQEVQPHHSGTIFSVSGLSSFLNTFLNTSGLTENIDDHQQCSFQETETADGQVTKDDDLMVNYSKRLKRKYERLQEFEMTKEVVTPKRKRDHNEKKIMGNELSIEIRSSEQGQKDEERKKGSKKENTEKMTKKRTWDRKNACIYCQEVVTNFSRHLLRHHANEIEVLNYKSIKDKDPKIRKQKRQAITDKLRNKGNFIHNSKVNIDRDGQSNILPKNRNNQRNSSPSSYVSCKICLDKLERHISKPKREKPPGVVNNPRVRKKLEALNVAAGQLEMVVLSWKEVELERQRALSSASFTRHDYKCHDCAVGFNHKFKLENHLRKHSPTSGDALCSVCKIRCKSEHALSAHRRRHRVRWRCCECGDMSSRAAVAADHYARVHGAPAPTHVCTVCQHQEPTLGKLRKHLTIHAEQQKCKLCGKTFRDKTSLRTHLFIHMGEKEHACPKCDKRFLFKKAMEIHMVTHDAPAQLYCHECDMNFKNQMSYYQHMKYNLKHIDPSKLKYACQLCDKKFVKAARLEEHNLAVHLKATPIRCTVEGCEFACSSRPVLRTHIRMLHRNHRLKRNHVCDTCGKAYTTKRTLEGHMRSHTGERPFKCEHCPSNFGYEAALYNHNKLVHLKSKGTRNKSRPKTSIPVPTNVWEASLNTTTWPMGQSQI